MNFEVPDPLKRAHLLFCMKNKNLFQNLGRLSRFMYRGGLTDKISCGVVMWL